MVHMPDRSSAPRTASIPNTRRCSPISSASRFLVLEALDPADGSPSCCTTVRRALRRIAPIVGRSTDAARQLASRARRRCAPPRRCRTPISRPTATWSRVPRGRQDGDFEALVALLAPDVVLRADRGRARRSVEVRGAEAVAKQASVFGRVAASARPALVNGAVGFVAIRNGRTFAVAGWSTVVDGTHRRDRRARRRRAAPRDGSDDARRLSCHVSLARSVIAVDGPLSKETPMTDDRPSTSGST